MTTGPWDKARRQPHGDISQLHAPENLALPGHVPLPLRVARQLRRMASLWGLREGTAAGQSSSWWTCPERSAASSQPVPPAAGCGVGLSSALEGWALVVGPIAAPREGWPLPLTGKGPGRGPGTGPGQTLGPFPASGQQTPISSSWNLRSRAAMGWWPVVHLATPPVAAAPLSF